MAQQRQVGSAHKQIARPIITPGSARAFGRVGGDGVIQNSAADGWPGDRLTA